MAEIDDLMLQMERELATLSGATTVHRDYLPIPYTPAAERILLEEFKVLAERAELLLADFRRAGNTANSRSIDVKWGEQFHAITEHLAVDLRSLNSMLTNIQDHLPQEEQPVG